MGKKENPNEKKDPQVTPESENSPEKAAENLQSKSSAEKPAGAKTPKDSEIPPVAETVTEKIPPVASSPNVSVTPAPRKTKPDLKPKKKRNWGRYALLFWTIFVAAGSFIGGWFAYQALNPLSESPKVEVVEVPNVKTEADLTMPDIRGLMSFEAKQLLV
ncbi:MAG: hypothetical protein CSA83_01845, partial [Actinomycetales bacterium]